MKYRFLSLLLGLFAFPLLASAEVGDNCSVDILSGVQDDSDWRMVSLVRGTDGSAWRRGIIFDPTTTFSLTEGEISTLSATVAPDAKTQVFLFAEPSESSAKVAKPSSGTCFEGTPSDAGGTTSFEINARILWENIDQPLYADVFYRLDQSWQQLQQSAQINQALIGAHNEPTKLAVRIDSQAQADIDKKGKIIIRDKNFAQSDDMRLYKRGAINNQVLTGVGWNDDGCQTFCNNQIQQSIVLDPKALPSEWHGNNFDELGLTSLLIGRSPGPHTFYTEVSDSNTDIDIEVMRDLTRKTLYMEALKRALLGNPYTNGQMPALTIIDDRQLRVVASGRGGYSEKTMQLVNNIRYLLLDPNLREVAAKFLADSIRTGDAFLMENSDVEWNMANALLEIMPAQIATSETWASDFVRLLEFWTASSLENVCLLLNDKYFGENFGLLDLKLSQCGMSYALGKTPLLQLLTTKPISLTPDFVGAKITYADQEMNTEQSFDLPAGKKQPLYYRYAFTTPFTKTVSQPMCVTKKRLPLLIERLQQAYALSATEVTALARELNSNWPTSNEHFVQLHLANPSDIAERLRWQGNGDLLKLLQLFFSLQADVCTIENLDVPIFVTAPNRDGFEAGILQ